MTEFPPIEKLTQIIKQSREILVFTGAGISTSSGIPDFRGPQGIWKKREPVYYQEFLQYEQSRIEHWDYKLEGYETFRDARPNAAHKALVDLEKKGKLGWLVTQNIDGLHETAGNSQEKIIELHGTNRWIECIQCCRRLEPNPIFKEFQKTKRPPICDCGGYLKTATIMFGQPMPQDKLQKAFKAAEQADLVISIGSTLEVEPAASVPLTARSKGTPYVIINRGPTAHDEFASLRLEGDVSIILPQAVTRLR